MPCTTKQEAALTKKNMLREKPLRDVACTLQNDFFLRVRNDSNQAVQQ